MKNLLTLHEAIVLALLSRKDRTATFAEIAAFIEKRGLYTERKGNISLSEQVMLRSTKSSKRYSYLFEVAGKDSITLKNHNYGKACNASNSN